MKILKELKNNIKRIIIDVKKNLNNVAIMLFLTILSLGIVIFFVNVPIDYNEKEIVEKRDYIVNKRSLKIHITDCPSVSKMRNHNKLFINDSLESLMNKGYYICNRCKSGAKRKNEFIASRSLENIENLLFGDEDIDFKSYDEYLNTIDEMGEWYVNHVPTYEGIIDDNIATDNAKEYYKNNKITKKGKLNCYLCDSLKDCKGDYTKAGDDCVRFVFSCLNSMNNDYIHLLSKYSKYKWSSINSKIINTRKNQLQYALTNLGFEIYDTESEKVDLNKDGYYDFEILPINKEFKLKKGDIISRDGHIHIYLNDNENFGWGKVNNVYPQKSQTYIDPNTNSIICNGESFDRVYRYIGEK